ncbi:protein D2-like [Agrilus planipennis]|uniref:Protein D2-like n=1 Tax=Agrilus planipennis TaxID=224129 RepID=A0A1W4WVN2_AGRPL|nr:protein D2-like [Agrilus planipennis]
MFRNLRKLKTPLRSIIRLHSDVYVCPEKTSCKERPKPMTVEEAFIKYCIIPDVICDVPRAFARVCFPSGKFAIAGNALTPTEVKDKPSVIYKADEDCYYFLFMVDPDAPCRSNPKFREWNHWMVGNIPGRDISRGLTLYQFIPSAPPKDTGFHRYIFLVYMQPMKYSFSDVEKLTNTSADGRGNFSVRDFAYCYSLGKPIAGNFYVAKYDSHVDKVYASLGVK